MRVSRKMKITAPTLFPFLSVLVCLIGALMLMAVTLTPASLISASSNVKIELIKSEEMQIKEPFFLECAADRVSSLDTSFVFPLEEEKKKLSDLVTNMKFEGTPFTDFLNKLFEKDVQQYLFFIVRPDGIKAYKTFLTIVEYYNTANCVVSITLTENLDFKLLQQELGASSKKVSFDSSKRILKFTRVMTEEERKLLKQMLLEKQNKDAIDELYEKSKSSVKWVDYGSELIPQNWSISVQTEAKEDNV